MESDVWKMNLLVSVGVNLSSYVNEECIMVYDHFSCMNVFPPESAAFAAAA